MMLMRSIRYLRASLLTLFVLAQVAGVTHLIYDHTLNVYEGTPVAAHHHVQVKPTIITPDADHHHGALALHDQCCALHTLAGPLPHIVNATPVFFVSDQIIPDELVAATGADPGVPDRPPRPATLS